MDVFYKNRSLSSLGFEYIPTAQEIGNDAVEFHTDWEEFNSRDGGVRYGERAQVKSFTLRFFYDEIQRSQKEQLIKLLDRKQYGDLYFEERPYAVYEAYVSERPTFEEYIRKDANGNELLSGNVVVHFQCYRPYAKFIINTWPETVTGRLYDETGMVTYAGDPMQMYANVGNSGWNVYTISADNYYRILNPGTEYADVCIQVDGRNGDPGDIQIKNWTTNQVCEIDGITKALTTDMSRWYEVDSNTGVCKFTNGSSLNTVSYLYHDYGYIKLAPSNTIRGISVNTTNGSNIVTSTEGLFTKDMVGKYMYLRQTWVAINGYTDSHTITLLNESWNTGTEIVDIVTMNIVQIQHTGDHVYGMKLIMTPYVR